MFVSASQFFLTSSLLPVLNFNHLSLISILSTCTPYPRRTMHPPSYLATLALIGASLLLSSGCGGPPPLHPIKGKITLGGKSYNRLIVYFRPAEGKADEYNLGVGETDKDGILTLRSAGG